MAQRKGSKLPAIILAMILVALAALVWIATPHFDSGRMVSNEARAIVSLRAYLGAQATFKRRRHYGGSGAIYANPFSGTGFPDLYCVGGPSGESRGPELKLIDLALAEAASPETSKAGYWFVDIIADRVLGPYDFTKECGLSAMPAARGKTGRRTFVTNVLGTVYYKDNGGKPVTVYPDVEKEGWLPVGM